MNKTHASKKKEKNAKTAVLFGITFWFVSALYFGNIITGVIFGLLFGSIIFATAEYLPKFQKRKNSKNLEKDLPFFLMEIPTGIGIGMQFEQCIAGVENNSVAEEFRRAIKEMEHTGATAQQALIKIGERTESTAIKRCVTQIIGIYEQGSSRESAEALKKIAMELLARQRAEIKEFSGKMILFSLLFVAVSAVVPAMFQSFALIGSMVLKTRFTAIQLLIIPAILFPALDIAILVYIRMKIPVAMRN